MAGEGHDAFCNRCRGSGAMWDESNDSVDGTKNAYGLEGVQVSAKTHYCRHLLVLNIICESRR